MAYALTENGIGWLEADGTWAHRHEWADLVRVYGYKEDLYFHDELWIGFTFRDGTSVEVGELDPLHMTALDAASGHFGIEAGTWYLETLKIPSFDETHHTLWETQPPAPGP
jgi:hypothetical protein